MVLLVGAAVSACVPAAAQDDNAAANAAVYDADSGGEVTPEVGAYHLAVALNELLLADASATAVLEQWCARRHIADPAVIVAEVDRGAIRPASEETRARLRVADDTPLAYRHVRLRCGSVVLSEADNWYVPERLTPAMRAALAGDTPFGKVIRPLEPTRDNLAASLEWDGQGEGELLRHRAVVSSGAGEPLAEVVEIYQQGIAAGED